MEPILKETKKIIGTENISTIFCRIHAYDSIMCGYVWFGFIDFMFNRSWTGFDFFFQETTLKIMIYKLFFEIKLT